MTPTRGEDGDNDSWHGAREDGWNTAAYGKAKDGARTELEGEAKSRVGEEIGSRQVRSGCNVIRTQIGRPIRDHGEDDSASRRLRQLRINVRPKKWRVAARS
jgi:hypothetical protein